ncbi:phage major capsid protein, partial [Butyribacter intestini]|uniref:phage major capsid protein n=1 Tax=Butyribacter intestini TaxID=1703332 RepID=UPI003AEF8385
ASEPENKKDSVKAFTNVLKAVVNGQPVAKKDLEVIDAMSEGSDPDGGLTVPKDISTKIKELRRSFDALEMLVNVEKVTTETGSRVIEKEADSTPFDNVDEAAEFGEISTPQFEKIDYKVKKKGGILKVTRELLQDTAENIMSYLNNWIAKKSKATRNALILKAVRENAAQHTVESIDDLKDIFNTVIDPAIAVSSCIVTNQDGYNWLDKLKDKDGRYIIQPNPLNKTEGLLFGKYAIKVVSNKTLKSNYPATGGYGIPIICGDLKEFVTIFDREQLAIDINDRAGEYWKRDETAMKVRERLDIQVVDKAAAVVAVVPVKADTDSNGKYSDDELNALTKEQILNLAESLGYEMTKTKADTKEEIVAEFKTKAGQ